MDDEALDGIAREVSLQLRFVRQADGRPLEVTASTGVASAAPHGEVRAVSSLLTEADVAMYDAKRVARGTWRRASDGVRSEHREQIEVASALRGALAAGRIDAWFQPIVAADDGRLLALEALGRWTEPGWGAMSPARFIPVAERAGLVQQVDLAVLRRAVQVFAPLRAAWPTLVLHANVSPQTLAEPTYANRCLALLEAHGLPPAALTMEITEGDLTVGHAQLETAIGVLRARGVQLAVDDFGVGASSLARLGALRPEVIKIDGSFVQDLQGDGGRICRVIIELARELGLSCVAEYVETETQALALAAMGCHALQGYGPGAPMPAAALDEWLERASAHAAAV
jgi:EAL domain-containing protein (putative c-di-GMP-specific phosphodiesterase class I)